MCNFIEWKDLKIVYKRFIDWFVSYFRYASLYFCVAIADNDNELIMLETIHRYVELLDKYFGSVCILTNIISYDLRSVSLTSSSTLRKHTSCWMS